MKNLLMQGLQFIWLNLNNEQSQESFFFL